MLFIKIFVLFVNLIVLTGQDENLTPKLDLVFQLRLFEEIEELTARNMEKDKREQELVKELDKLR